MLNEILCSFLKPKEEKKCDKEEEEIFFQFMDKTTEEHLKLMNASLDKDKDTNTLVETQEEEWIDVNDI